MRILLLLLLLLAVPAAAQPAGQRFVVVAFHDVVDTRAEMDYDAVDSARLVRFFDWLKGDGWTAISLDDVQAAGQGGRPLPDKSILLTFDDGYRSVYTRVFPLVLAYRFPIVIGLVGRWMDTPMGGTVQYGDATVPRRNFLDWQEVRTMQASGLVEVASHSFDMHQGILANPQGNMMPAAMTWRYDAALRRYETDAEHRNRVRADLEKSARSIAAQTGRRPRAIIWPFGRYSGLAVEAAHQAGYRFALALEPEPADAARPMSIPRYFPTRDPRLGEIADNLRFLPPKPAIIRAACLRTDVLAAQPIGPAQDAVFGAMLEKVQALGLNTVILDGGAPVPAPGAPLGAVRFPTALRPMDADVLSRAVWQLRTRGGVDVFVTLDVPAATAAVGAERVPALFADMMRATGADGVALPGAGQGTPSPDQSPSAWTVRRLRQTAAPADPAQHLAIEAARAAASIDPRAKLILLAPTPVPAGPPPWADMLLLPPVGQDAMPGLAQGLRSAGWLRPEFAGRMALSLPAQDPAGAMRAAQQYGASAFALCPAGPALPGDPALPPVFSGASFPYQP